MESATRIYRQRDSMSSDEKLHKSRINSLRCKYRKKGIPEEEIDGLIEERKKNRIKNKNAKLAKEQVLLKMKLILRKIKTTITDIDELNIILSKLDEFNNEIHTESDSDN
jgi:hypothetical protein